MNQQIGRYRLLKRLALGGMAEIWLARQGGAQGFEKLVVIKRILPHLAENPEFVEMFLDEARLVAHLSHPNIAQIYDLGHEDGSYFIAMEHVHGENLRTVLKRRGELGLGALPGPLVARIGAACCQALAYAHAATDAGGRPLNVVHRDVSPQNLLLAYDGQVKVVDFGIAKAATQAVETRTGVLKGKYSYMSPEHCKGDPLDGRSDLFALGVVLWELVSGRRLYSRTTDMQTFMAICNEPPPSLAEVGAEVSASLDSVIRRALEKDRDARFADGYQMADALERYLRELEAPVTQRDLAASMEGLFAERIAGWRTLLQGDAAEVDEALMGARSDLFQQGTPSRSAQPAPEGSAPDLATGATVIRPDAVAPAAPVVVPVALAGSDDPADEATRLRGAVPDAEAAARRRGADADADAGAGAPGEPRPRRPLLFGGLAVATAGVVAVVLLALGHSAKAPAHAVASAHPAPSTGLTPHPRPHPRPRPRRPPRSPRWLPGRPRRPPRRTRSHLARRRPSTTRPRSTTCRTSTLPPPATSPSTPAPGAGSPSTATPWGPRRSPGSPSPPGPTAWSAPAPGAPSSASPSTWPPARPCAGGSPSSPVTSPSGSSPGAGSPSTARTWGSRRSRRRPSPRGPTGWW